MMTGLGASRAAILWRIRVPAAVPSLCSGLRLAAVYAPIGAVIGEWVGGEARGLGYLMTYANSRTTWGKKISVNQGRADRELGLRDDEELN